MKSKLKFIVPVLLIVLGGAYKFVLAKPAAAEPKPKVDGQVYVLTNEFLIHLREDEPCLRCGRAVRKLRAARPTGSCRSASSSASNRRTRATGSASGRASARW